MVRYSGRHSEGKSTEDVHNNRQKSNPTRSNSSRNIRDSKGYEAATKSKWELEEDMSCIESPPSDDLKVAAEAGLEAAFHSAKAEKFKEIQRSLYKKAKTGSRSGSSTDEIEGRI
ncbi:uncharacterized protein EAE98_010430 [Botrytis deweyae]|uniref:Uncharacterized protein n=1 Tax=Botrytis deweyae TaxID=2478750 RepID=A0ABQ7I925_9HELO|nr:uncharacterized protein EAE98_010430 [Botrytis deweyae]KAF7916999.1 hypothetical protein EAE98_010430 [Botrytis deweyae]